MVQPKSSVLPEQNCETVDWQERSTVQKINRKVDRLSQQVSCCSGVSVCNKSVFKKISEFQRQKNVICFFVLDYMLLQTDLQRRSKLRCGENFEHLQSCEKNKGQMERLSLYAYQQTERLGSIQTLVKAGVDTGEGPLHHNQGVNKFAGGWSLFGEKPRLPAYWLAPESNPLSSQEWRNLH